MEININKNVCEFNLDNTVYYLKYDVLSKYFGDLLNENIKMISNKNNKIILLTNENKILINPEEKIIYKVLKILNDEFFKKFIKNYFIDELDKTKNNVIKLISELFDLKINKIKGQYSKEEIESFNLQYLEYCKFKENNDAFIPFIETLALSRNIEKETLIEKIGQKIQDISFLQGAFQNKRNSIENGEIDEIPLIFKEFIEIIK